MDFFCRIWISFTRGYLLLWWSLGGILTYPLAHVLVPATPLITDILKLWLMQEEASLGIWGVIQLLQRCSKRELCKAVLKQQRIIPACRSTPDLKGQHELCHTIATSLKHLYSSSWSDSSIASKLAGFVPLTTLVLTHVRKNCSRKIQLRSHKTIHFLTSLLFREPDQFTVGHC